MRDIESKAVLYNFPVGQLFFGAKFSVEKNPAAKRRIQKTFVPIDIYGKEGTSGQRLRIIAQSVTEEDKKQQKKRAMATPTSFNEQTLPLVHSSLFDALSPSASQSFAQLRDFMQSLDADAILTSIGFSDPYSPPILNSKNSALTFRDDSQSIVIKSLSEAIHSTSGLQSTSDLIFVLSFLVQIPIFSETYKLWKIVLDKLEAPRFSTLQDCSDFIASQKLSILSEFMGPKIDPILTRILRSASFYATMKHCLVANWSAELDSNFMITQEECQTRIKELLCRLLFISPSLLSIEVADVLSIMINSDYTEIKDLKNCVDSCKISINLINITAATGILLCDEYGKSQAPEADTEPRNAAERSPDTASLFCRAGFQQKLLNWLEYSSFVIAEDKIELSMQDLKIMAQLLSPIISSRQAQLLEPSLAAIKRYKRQIDNLEEWAKAVKSQGDRKKQAWEQSRKNGEDLEEDDPWTRQQDDDYVHLINASTQLRVSINKLSKKKRKDTE